MAESSTVPSAFLAALLAVLESRFGHEVDSGKLAQTLAGAGFGGDVPGQRLEAYLTLLRTLPLEAPLVQALVQPAMNNESYFFRDPASVATLREHVLPPLIAAASATRVLRIWSAGCSTGEELYTISILLHELIPDLDSWTIALVGTDVDDGALVHARTARYAVWSLRSTTQDQRARYFQHDRAGDRYLLRDRYRRHTSFSLHNLVDEGASAPAPGAFDLVLCRNVSIYLTPHARAAVDRKLSAALSAHGWWISGPSDPLPSCAGVASIVLPGLLAHRHASATELRAVQLPVRKSPLPPPTIQARRSSPPPPPPPPAAKPEPRLLPLRAEAAAALPGSAQRRASIPAPALARQLEIAREHANRNQHDEAHELIDDALAQDAMLVEGYLLRADLYESEQDDRAALEALRCALYLDPELIEAHFRAGLLLERLGDRKGAILALRNAAALERSSIDGSASGLGQLAAMRLTLLLTEDAR